MFLKESKQNRLSIDYYIPSPRRFDPGVGAVGRLVYKGMGKAVISYGGKNDRCCYELAQLGRWKGGKLIFLSIQVSSRVVDKDISI